MLNSVRVMRGIAAMAVVLFHFKPILAEPGGELSALVSWLSYGGTFGVCLFFLISGFVITVATEAGTAKPGAFLVKRLFRIVPLATVMTVAYFSAEVLLDWKPMPQSGDLLKSLLFLPLLNSNPPFFGYRILSVQWTLTYELVFYGLFFVALCVSDAWRVGIASVLVILIVFGMQLNYGALTLDAYESPLAPGAGALSGMRSLLANPLLLLFVVGMGVARGYALILESGYPRPLMLVFCLAGLALYLSHHGVSGPMIFSLCTFLVLLLIEKFIRADGWMGGVCRLGDLSYSVYLIHPLVYLFYAWLSGQIAGTLNLPGILIVVGLLMATMAVSALSYRYIELPAIRLGRKIAGAF